MIDAKMNDCLRAAVLQIAWVLAMALASCAISQYKGLAPVAERTIEVDCNFPGGNIVLDGIEGDTVRLHQDLRDTKGDWFYWYFRVRGAAGRTLTFQFTRSNPIGVLGPAVSTDGGKSWQWLGKSAVKGSSFLYTFPNETREVRFCMGMPYLESNLHEFIKRHVGDSHLKVGTLCKTKKGRKVEYLRLGKVGWLRGKPDHRVLIACRHHCCEMMASYALEGLMEAVLANTDDGRWFRRHVEFLVVPFMDKDGVEDGDQGKNRMPHDHNRDYGGKSIYSSVAAIREIVPKWSKGQLRFALDMHCPYIRGKTDEYIYFVGGRSKENWERVGQFSQILESVQRGPLVYRAENNMPFGTAWNTAANEGNLKSFGRWAAEIPGILVGTSIEIPYANVSGTPATAATARAFGHDLARALRVFLEKEAKN